MIFNSFNNLLIRYKWSTRVKGKLLQKDISEVQTGSEINGLIIRNASNNFRFIILNPTQRTSKSAPRFLPKKRIREHASTPMNRLPQCHLGNPWVECQNIYQVNQYDTPLSPWLFNCKTYIKCSQIHKSTQSDNNEISKGKLNSSPQDREGKHHMIRLY